MSSRPLASLEEPRRSFSASQLAEILGAELLGDPTRIVTALRAVDRAGPDEMAFLSDERHRSEAEKSRAGVFLLSRAMAELDGPFTKLILEDARAAFPKAATLFHPPYRRFEGIHETACIAADAHIADGVSIGAYAVIGRGTRIGSGTMIRDHVTISEDVEIGQNVVLYPQVVVRRETHIGDRVIIQPGSVIGCDGFGFVFVDGQHRKVPQSGRVVLEDDVEIGANCAIDRAALEDTRIKRGTKLDNLVHVGHGVEIGEFALVVAQVGIAGGTRIGAYSRLGGQSGFVGHVVVGKNAEIAAQAGVIGNVPDNVTFCGYPARKLDEAMEGYANVRRLPRLFARIKELERELRALKDRSSQRGGASDQRDV